MSNHGRDEYYPQYEEYTDDENTATVSESTEAAGCATKIFSGDAGEMMLQKIQELDATSTGDDMREVLSDLFFRMQDLEKRM